MTSLEGIYLYCIIPKQENIKIENIGLEEGKLYTVEYKDILAVVSNVPYKVYDFSMENIEIHENVVKDLMNYYTVLPFNYGNVLKTRNDLNSFLKATYINLKKNILKVTGKIEVGLKIFIKSEYLNSVIENDDIRRMKKQIAGMNEQLAVNLKVELGRMVKKALEKKQGELESKIFLKLKKFSSHARSNECNTVNMVLNASFLIEKEKLDLFTEELNKLTPSYDEKYMIKFTGPWPPYNFVEISK
ncbi:gas vesicle protein GvpL/GvpF [Lachnotalea glycerini]|nr:GvpL/GvpF family gas vesicle protein [Lachnotalea glycerini]PXV85958.1 gas vesicle protein GvpL/GvpF [Lachnotalea glycerini]